MNTGYCSIEGCGSPCYGRGYCKFHHQKWWHLGDPVSTFVQRKAKRGEAWRWIIKHVDHKGSDCLIWPFGRAFGYGVINWRGRARPAHNLMCELAHGPAPTPAHVSAHSCGRGRLGCTNPLHVRWATPKENSEDSLIHGVLGTGESHPNAKLDVERALLIYHDPRGPKELSELFGCTPSAISLIRHGHTWSSVTGHKRKA